MRDNNGLATILFGTTIAAAGLAVKPIARYISCGITGFGLAFMLLGALSTDENRKHIRRYCK
jgi:hypothetical protein